MEYPDLIVNLTNYSVIYMGHSVEMPPKELELLYFLASSPNQVFTREQLYRQVWNEHVVDDNTIMVYIKRIREKIEEDSRNPVYLRTVRGIGYIFNDKE